MRTYDLVMTHKLDADDFFIHRVQRHCAESGLNFFLIEPVWVEAFKEKLEKEKIRVRVLLNMHSEHHQEDEIYHRLVKSAHERQIRIIDAPDVALAAFDKARMHVRLHDAGFAVPETLIVSREQIPAFTLSEADLRRIGSPFVVKPSLGYGKRGVLLNATGRDDLMRSAQTWPDRSYLVQQKIVPRQYEGVPMYFRGFYAFGSVWLCWWNCYTDRYRAVSAAETAALRLAPLRELVRRLAQVSGMHFFSTEVAQVDSGEFVIIDYINDQCHMLTQSADPKMGVPDEVVAAIARTLVLGAGKWIAEQSRTSLS
jgi:hypothetical protein